MTAAILICLGAIIALNAMVVMIATRAGNRRERAVDAGKNVYRFYRRTDIRV